jgi:hypothetical protein
LTETSRIQDNPLAPRYAEVAKLADALDSGSSARKGVRVQIPPSAPTMISPLLLKAFTRFNPIIFHTDSHPFGRLFRLNRQVTVK